jgi:putative membrane protein
MHIVRTIFWVLLAIALVLFAVANWRLVEVAIGGGMVLETRLPVVVIGAFLLGLVPMWLVHRTVLWRMRRRLAAAIPHTTADAAGSGVRTDDGAGGHGGHPGAHDRLSGA